MRVLIWFCVIVLANSAQSVMAHQEGGALAALSAGARSYRLLATQISPLEKLDASALSANQRPSQNLKIAYARFAHAQYQQALSALAPLALAIDELLAKPNSANLAKARKAWLAARPAYLYTEVFRFYEGPIDADFGVDQATGLAAQTPKNYESRINAWPLNEAVLDYVKGAPSAGLVQNLALPLSATNILALDQTADESDVTTGWHAIEFLLWGQDFASNGPGDRAVSDFADTSETNARRRLLLQLLLSMLAQDLSALANAWDLARSDSYASKFIQIDAYEAIGRMLTGAAMLAGNELASQRLTVALDSGTQEDEHSCFSDSSSSDFRAGVAGISILFGDDGAGLISALEKLDALAAKRLRTALATAEKAVAKIAAPFDQVLTSKVDSAKRNDAEQAALALQHLAKEIASAGRSFGVLVSVPGL